MPEFASPSVVALLPSYNAAEFIEKTLTSLLGQNYLNLKVIVSDDNSTDQTVDICRQIALGDKRVEIRVHEKNLGWIANVNELLLQAEGDYFFIAPHDDVFHADYVKTLVEKLEQDERAILAFADTDFFLYQGSADLRRYRQLEGIKSPVLRGIKILVRLGPWWIPYRGLIRRNALDQNMIHLNSSAGEFAADWPWLLGLGLRGGFIRVPRVLCHKHQTKSSVAGSWNYTLQTWLAVTATCLKVINQSPLSVTARSILYLATLLAIPRHLLGVTNHRLKELLQKSSRDN